MVESVKNALSAVADLGLGDQLVQQLQDQEDTRKKQPGQTLNAAAFGGVTVGSLMAARSLGLT